MSFAGVFQFTRPAASKRFYFDGRLDNRADLMLRLRDDLRDDFTDAAIALTALRKWGAEGLVHLIGDWSLVRWDAEERTLLLASDFAGVRPLYYSRQHDRVRFSTSLASLVQDVQPSGIDEDFIAGFLASGAAANRTPYPGIHSVPPGHAVRISERGTAVERFWSLPIGNAIRYRRESDYEEQLRSLFRDAVRCRLRGGSTALAELSGGLDSSSIVCMASHLVECGEADAARLVTVSYDHPGSLDSRFCKSIEAHCGVSGVHIPTAERPFLTEKDTGGTTPAFWEPLHRHTGDIARETGANTYLTGRMGDLTMGNWGDDSDQVAGLLRSGHIGPAFRQALAWSKVLRIPIYWVLGNAFRLNLPPSFSMRKVQRPERSAAPSSEEDSIAPAFRDRIATSTLSRQWMEAPPERRKLFHALADTLELRKLQPPEPLQHLFYTHPFAHRPLVEFMCSIPADIVCRAGEPRRLMRRAFHELWPAELRKRRSKGSFGGVFLDSLRPLAHLLLQERTLQVVERGYLECASLRCRLERLTQSLDCNEAQLRQVILLELWLRARSNAAIQFASGDPLQVQAQHS